MKRLLIACMCLFTAGCANVDKANSAWSDWLTSNRPGIEIVSQSCDEMDSDQNGRVRCNASYKEIDGKFTTVTMECPSAWLFQFSDTCQEPALRR